MTAPDELRRQAWLNLRPGTADSLQQLRELIAAERAEEAAAVRVQVAGEIEGWYRAAFAEFERAAEAERAARRTPDREHIARTVADRRRAFTVMDTWAQAWSAAKNPGKSAASPVPAEPAWPPTFEELLTDPLEQFDRRSELLPAILHYLVGQPPDSAAADALIRSVEDYRNAPPCAASSADMVRPSSVPAEQPPMCKHGKSGPHNFWPEPGHAGPPGLRRCRGPRAEQPEP